MPLRESLELQGQGQGNYMVVVKHEVKRATSFFMVLLSHLWLVRASLVAQRLKHLPVTSFHFLLP